MTAITQSWLFISVYIRANIRCVLEMMEVVVGKIRPPNRLSTIVLIKTRATNDDVRVSFLRVASLGLLCAC